MRGTDSPLYPNASWDFLFPRSLGFCPVGVQSASEGRLRSLAVAYREKTGICNSRWLPVSVTAVELMAGATGWP